MSPLHGMISISLWTIIMQKLLFKKQKMRARLVRRSCNIRLRVVEWVALKRFLFGVWHY